MKDLAEERMRLCRRTLRKAYGFPVDTFYFLEATPPARRGRASTRLESNKSYGKA